MSEGYADVLQLLRRWAASGAALVITLFILLAQGTILRDDKAGLVEDVWQPVWWDHLLELETLPKRPDRFLCWILFLHTETRATLCWVASALWDTFWTWPFARSEKRRQTDE